MIANIPMTEIVDGHPRTMQLDGTWDSNVLSDLSERTQKIVLWWLRSNFVHGKGFSIKAGSSYKLKHILQRQAGIYTFTNQFKDAMLQAGFFVKNKNDIDWYYDVSPKLSPCFQKHKSVACEKKSIYDFDGKAVVNSIVDILTHCDKSRCDKCFFKQNDRCVIGKPCDWTADEIDSVCEGAIRYKWDKPIGRN